MAVSAVRFWTAFDETSSAERFVVVETVTGVWMDS